MKKNRYGLLLLLALILFPIKVFALSGDVAVSCTPSTAKPGDKVACVITGTSPDNIDSVSMNISVGNGLYIESFDKNNDNWNGGLDDDYLTLYVENNDMTGSFAIGTLNIKVNDNATPGTTSINLTNINVFNLGNKYSVTDKAATITIANNVEPSKGLKSLRPTVGNFGVQFTAERDSYILTIPGNVTSFGLIAEAYESSDEIAFFQGESRTPITDSNNIAFTTDTGKTEMMTYIEVGSGDRKVTYTIGVRKDVSTGTSNELSSLTVGDQVVTLISGKYDDYNVILNDVTSFTVVADLKDRENFVIRNLNNLTSRSGEGPFSIIIDPKDSTSGFEGVTYTINVIKNGTAPAPSSSSESSSSRIVNPTTSGIAPVIMAIILMASFGVSIYYYKKNISYLSK